MQRLSQEPSHSDDSHQCIEAMLFVFPTCPSFYLLQIVTQPMDFSTIVARLKETNIGASYATFEDFSADVRLVFSNCLLVSSATTSNRGGAGLTFCVLCEQEEGREEERGACLF